MPTAQKNGRAEVLTNTSNDAATIVATLLPYSVEFTLEGVAPLLFHAWSNESVAEKSAAKKGSAAKKTDDIESYVYRDEQGFICIPGKYVHASVSSKKEGAARYFQDPRSPRKSAVDLYKAATLPTTILARILDADGKPTKKWDFLDQCRMVVSGSGITRQRPGFNAGWKANFVFQINLPEYVSHQDFHAVLALAGRSVGLGDSRPTYGRFVITRFEVL